MVLISNNRWSAERTQRLEPSWKVAVPEKRPGSGVETNTATAKQVGQQELQVSFKALKFLLWAFLSWVVSQPTWSRLQASLLKYHRRVVAIGNAKGAHCGSEVRQHQPDF